MKRSQFVPASAGGMLPTQFIPRGRAGKSAHPSHVIEITRIAGLQTAAGMLGGQQPLAAALDIGDRALRAKLQADRGVSRADLIATADALDARAARIADHARKLREIGAA